LGTLAAFRNGINYTKKNFGRGIKVVNVKDFKEYSALRREHLDEIDPEGIVRPENLLRDDDILFVRSNGNRELIGRSLLIRGCHEPLTHSAFTIRVRFHANLAHPRFFAYFFRAAQVRQILSAFGGGTNISNLNQRILAQLQVPLPPLKVQYKVALLLGQYDDLMAINRQRTNVLEELVRLVYEEWFASLGIDRTDRRASSKPKTGELPTGWKLWTLGAIAEQLRRNTRKGKVAADTRYVGLEHLPRRSITLVDWAEVSEIESNKLRFEEGEILFGKIRPYFHKVVLAPFAGLCSADTIVIRPREPRFLPLVLAHVSSDDFVAHATATSKGSKMPRADWEVLARHPVPMPPARVLGEFNRIIEPVLESLQNLMWRNRVLRTTRDLLLPKLISGEIDVSSLEIAGAEASAA
jgi:type I restriction enzyme S subunit